MLTSIPSTLDQHQGHLVLGSAWQQHQVSRNAERWALTPAVADRRRSSRPVVNVRPSIWRRARQKASRLRPA